MKLQDQKKIVICLRWTVIIVTSYLILFGRESLTQFNWGHVFILVYILSNVVVTFLPRSWFSHESFFYTLAVFDIGIISLGMYLSDTVTTDFYLVFFLIVIIVSMSRNFRLLMILSGVISLLYGFLLYTWGLLESSQGVSYWLRIPFIFIIAAFYGFLVQSFTKEKQDQLAVSEERYRGLFENSNDGIVISMNAPFQIVDANRKAEEITGFRKEDLRRKTVIDLFPSEERTGASHYLEEVMSKGEGRTEAFSWVREDGTAFEMDLSIKRVDLGDVPLNQMVLRDLTDQRKLERKIRESKRGLQAIVDGMRDQLSLQNLDYEILRVNRAVVEKYRTSFQDLIGKKCHETYYGRSTPCDECPVARTMETKQPDSSIRKISEGDMILRTDSYPIFDEQRNLVSVLEYTQDITLQQRLQEQLLRSEKLAGLGVLTSGIAHEINNPLSGVVGMAEVALEEEDPLKIKDYLKDILSCGQKIAEIVKEFSSYSRMAKREDQTRVDVIEVLENVLKMVRRVTKTPVKVIRDLRPVQPLEANSGEIQLVFHHLITNAFQAMIAEGGRLTLCTRSLNDHIEIKVTDDGIGIPQKYLSQIFDPFFTTKEVGAGKGLGLNTVYRIITKYDGIIKVESKEHVGTTFSIQFPTRRNA
jgi:two-component system cell cycle sensor histidine kinase/response regulator CckA